LKVALIGGAGFVGTYLRKRLTRNGFKVKVLDIKRPTSECDYEYFDVTDETCISPLVGSDVVINLAAEHRDDVSPVSRYYDVNVNGASLLCEKAEKLGIEHIIFTSSVAVFGFAPPGTNESGAHSYFNEYGKTKHLAEVVYRNWQSKNTLTRTLVIVRPTVIFGPGNRGNVFNLLNQIASKRFIMFGKGSNVKSMAYVENIAQFLNDCMNFDAGLHVYNYVDAPDLSMNELVEFCRWTLFKKKGVGLRLPAFIGVGIGSLFDLFSMVTGKKLPVSSVRVKKFMGTTSFSSSVAERGFLAEHTLLEGLSKTLNYEFLEDHSGEETFYTE
jgi:nucleoside-diphosphate-sugar epimerase